MKKRKKYGLYGGSDELKHTCEMCKCKKLVRLYRMKNTDSFKWLCKKCRKGNRQRHGIKPI